MSPQMTQRRAQVLAPPSVMSSSTLMPVQRVQGIAFSLILLNESLSGYMCGMLFLRGRQLQVVIEL